MHTDTTEEIEVVRSQSEEQKEEIVLTLLGDFVTNLSKAGYSKDAALVEGFHLACELAQQFTLTYDAKPYEVHLKVYASALLRKCQERGNIQPILN